MNKNNKPLDRAFIYLTVVSSLDGRISKGPDRDMWEDLADSRTSDVDNTAFYEEIEKKLNVMHNPQADMLGSNSLVKVYDSIPTLPPFKGNKRLLYKDFLPEKIMNNPEHRGWLVVVDGQGRIRNGWRGGDPPGWHMIHLVSHNVPCEYLAFLRNKEIPYLLAGEKRVDLKLMMKKLKNKLGIECIKTTAGGNLAGALLRAGLIDEINIIFSPYLVGGFKTPKLFDSDDLKANEPFKPLRLLSSRVEDSGHIWVRYEVIHHQKQC